VTLGTGPTDGVLTLAADGTFTYVPDAGSSGTDGFTYTLTADGGTDTATVLITIGTYAADDVRSTPADTALVVPAPGVLGNDSGSGLTAALVDAPTHGTVSLAASGLFTYTPAAGFSGTDTFTYRITDDEDQTDTARVTITVTPVAVDDTAATYAGGTVTVPVRANDRGTDLVVASVTQPAVGNGTVALVGGAPVYTAPTGFAGTATFTYTVVDAEGRQATATVTVTVVSASAATTDSARGVAGQPAVLRPLTNDAPSAGATWDATTLVLIDPATGAGVRSLMVERQGRWEVQADGTVVFTPVGGFTGTASVGYRVTDTAGSTSTSTLTVVYPAPALPVTGASLAGVGAALVLLTVGVGLVAARRRLRTEDELEA
ncbi:MAG: hypothetical protein JWP95_1723, partial [Actinotalea sp.]|nr:hypothetical protein [Actinotalea sp.]